MSILLTLIHSCITSINDSCDDTFVSVHTYSGSRTGLLHTMRWSKVMGEGCIDGTVSICVNWREQLSYLDDLRATRRV